jgi:hypothetical protein
LTEIDNRVVKDRRKKETPLLSRHVFFGRREGFRRKPEQERGGYVDRYNSKLFILLVLILGLNILDIIFTMMILDHKGWELNPVVQSVMNIYGDRFWLWKFFLVSSSLALLCLHSKFKAVHKIILGLSLIYLLIIFYQIFILVRL